MLWPPHLFTANNAPGYVETARVLLDHGANVDHQNGCIQSVDWTGGLDYWTDLFSSKTQM